mgnify:CR=1 FL=1
MLSAGTAGTVGIDPQIIRVDLDIKVFLDIRHYIAGYERGLALSSRIKRRDTDQTVNAMFGF